MMKRITAFLMAILLVLGSTGCSQKPMEPNELYAAAVEKTSQLKAVDMAMELDMSFSMFGMMLEAKTMSEIQSQQKDDSLTLAMLMTMDMMGMTIDMNMYYVDGVIYVDSEGEKLKMSASPTEAMDVMQSTDISKQFAPQDAMTDLAATDLENGMTKLTFTADGSKLTDYVIAMLGDSAASILGDVSTGSIKVSDISGSITVNKDLYIVESEMNIEVEAMGMGLAFVVRTELRNPGQDVKFDLPDFSEYVEGTIS